MNQHERELQKRVEQAEYKAKQANDELNAVRSSKAFRVAKAAGVMKNRLRSDPVGLSRKVAGLLLNDPKKLVHVFRSADRISSTAQGFNDQNIKYQEWILLNEPDEAELDEQRKESAQFAYSPLISFLTPVFNPPADVLEELIESVLEQTYPNFELLLGDFGDSEPVTELIKKYAEIDHRVKYFKFTKNLGIAGNSNQILEKVEGEFTALLDHDDTISPDALYENVKRLNEQEYDFLYSDKDKIDEKGTRFDPLFKPKLSPEMLLNINYLTHLNLMRTSIVREIGGWDSDTDGAQDWDIFMRMLVASNRVCHVPKILYHWRVIESSTAMSIETKPYALAGQRKSVDKYLKSKNLPATSFHQKTELFLKWDKNVLDQRPHVFIYLSSPSHTLRVIRHVQRVVESPRFVVLADTPDKSIDKNFTQLNHVKVMHYDAKQGLQSVLATYAQSLKSTSGTALFIRDSIRLPKKNDWYENLVGWLAIEDVAAASGRLVDKHDLIVDSGALISKEGKFFPLFYKFPRFYQSYIGNAEWVRDLSVLTSNFFATDLKKLASYAAAHAPTTQFFEEYFLDLSSHQNRLVMTPHVTATIFDETISGQSYELRALAGVTDYVDVFGNQNLSAGDPTRLFSDEMLVGVDAAHPEETVDSYQHDAVILAQTYDITQEDIDYNYQLAAKKGTGEPKSVAWLLPSYDAVYAGLTNIFSFADFLLTKKGLKTTFYILSADPSAQKEKTLAQASFASMANATFETITPDQVEKIKRHDIGIATLWSTAYPLAKSRAIGKKFYFIQDNETNFYPKGSVSALVEFSYRFGFSAIANTLGLLDMYEKQYGGAGLVTKSLVDLSNYYPREDKYYTPKKTYKVFFYARPKMPRNAFELGIAGLKKLKADLGNDVEIITAGAEWDAAAYGAEGLFTNLGKIAYDAVPKLYRSVDAGLMFMFSGHPGVTASELMASGCPVVVNQYDDVTWYELYRHEETCLVTLPTASEVARNLRRCFEDTELRKTLIDGGLAKVEAFYSKYEDSLEQAYRAMISE